MELVQKRKQLYFLCVALLVLTDWLAHAVRICNTPAVVFNVFIPFMCFMSKHFKVYMWLQMVTKNIAVCE